MQTKRRKMIRWYLVEGGGLQHFQIKLKFWHYTNNKFDLYAYRHKHMKLFIDIVMKRIYLFDIVAWNYRKKIGFPVSKKENFAGLQAHRKRGKSARAIPTPHHTLSKERSARFTAQHLSALEKAVAVQLQEHILVSGLFPELQSAYHQHHSTATAIIKVKNDLLMAIDKGQVRLPMLLD